MHVAAIPSVDRAQHLVVTVDALVAGVHFAEHWPADLIAYKSLAVNLSDLAAMGAEPLAAHASRSDRDASWLKRFDEAFERACVDYSVQSTILTDRGPMGRICVQAFGQVPANQALRRDGARAGDQIWVSGTLGDAGAGLAIEQGRLKVSTIAEREWFRERLTRPSPRVALGVQLRGIANAAIDVSDGLVGDAGHVAERSHVAMVLEAPCIPISDALRGALPGQAALALALSAGDDYELCFTAPLEASPAVEEHALAAGVSVCRVGEVRPGSGVVVLDGDGVPIKVAAAYQHFTGIPRRSPH